MKKLKRKLLDKIREILAYVYPSAESKAIRESLVREEMRLIRDDLRRRDPGAIMLHGFKAYSQCDEDGIIEHIFRLIGEKSKIFIEAGCGNGLENNTHYLLLKGWRGVWIEGNQENTAFIRSELGQGQNNVLSLCESFITAENFNDIVGKGLERLGINHPPMDIDFLSLDIDGNELYVLKSLGVVRPRLICVEYNAKFPPPAEIAIQYRPSHMYAGDDYQGASLQSIVNVLEPEGYKLIACNISGVNAFFVKNTELAEPVTNDTASLYQPPRHHLIALSPGLSPSLKFIRDRLNSTDGPLV